MSEKQVLLGLIDQKVTELADQVIPEKARQQFNSGLLEHRIMALNIFATIAGDDMVSSVCQEWLQIIGRKD